MPAISWEKPMPIDNQFVYSLELKILDLEKLVKDLEKRIDDLEAQQASAAQLVQPDVPEDVLKQIEAGENPIRALRQYRLLTQKELSNSCGIRANHISAMERGMPFGLKTAKRLAEALEVPVGLLTR
ncbi:helix-turn-helix transcriptional regulator [uncultured Hyphomonas sp.]|uniref:helix-turn-helix domain-containing protein n=1 Tax=uncultured Hyphomonas sp. TaxID=225298 RepID=UPI002AAB1B15|nr:helix-turn-helix transcriptional regulator [uncultured Hyphomonas sp.]